MKQEDKSENYIKVPIYYYQDSNGKKVYDYEEMDLEYQMEKDKLEKKENKE